MHKLGGRNALLRGSQWLPGFANRITANLYGQERCKTERPLTSKREPRGRARPRVSHRLVHWLTLIFLSVGEYAVFYGTYNERSALPLLQ